MSVQVEREESFGEVVGRPPEAPAAPSANGGTHVHGATPHAAAGSTASTTSPAVGATAAPPGVTSPATAHPASPVVSAPAPRRRPAFLNRRVLLPVFGAIVVVAAVVGYNAYRDGQLYVSTENAQITGQPVQVGAMNAGQVESITPTIGAAVHKGDVIARVVLPSQVGAGQSGQAKMGFLGAGDTRVDVQAPIDGIVIAEPVGVGSNVAPGQAIVSLVDPSQLWVNANIEETNIARVKTGQPVTVHVDALGVDVPGKVEAITPATASSFSILPSSNASGNFTKVTQLVPVRIAVNLGNQPLLLGANVEVKIRVAD